jgi:hypothetical protein
MIITRQKEFDYLLELIEDKSVFIVGCSECATICHTGGEEELLEMKKKLVEKKINVTGSVVLEPACHLLNDKRILKKYTEELNKTDKILVLACGNGVQTVAEIFNRIDIIPGTDTLFLGEIKRLDDFRRRCNMCGECLQDLFDGVCPIGRCPKFMLNGPCGGAVNGKCEVNKNLECVWCLIIDKLKDKDQLNRLKKICEPKDWSKSTLMEWKL